MSSTYQNGEEEKKRGRKKVHIDVWNHLIFQL
jgi:uncharacterized protein YggL (DUF469 family)